VPKIRKIAVTLKVVCFLQVSSLYIVREGVVLDDLCSARISAQW